MLKYYYRSTTTITLLLLVQEAAAGNMKHINDGHQTQAIGFFSHLGEWTTDVGICMKMRRLAGNY